jgi:hypothetical protein
MRLHNEALSDDIVICTSVYVGVLGMSRLNWLYFIMRIVIVIIIIIIKCGREEEHW